MKHWICPLLLMVIISCSDQKPKVGDADTIDFPTLPTLPGTEVKDKNEICWTGTLNGKIPVFLHYIQDSNLIIGEITYLNTKDKQPIKLLGTIEDDKTFRLLEFQKNGNITGIITGMPTENSFIGSWFSPKTRKELFLKLIKKDSNVNSVTSHTEMQDIFGHYHYQYSEEGYHGDFEITQLPNSKAIFSITSVTGEPGRNVAQIDEDTINLKKTNFVYKLTDSDDCEFKVTFFKGFALIQYTKGFCDGQFGMNATIEGLFLKTK